jgi:hypothetical protein
MEKVQTAGESISDYKGIRTFTGIDVDVFNPTPEMFCIEDIAHSLACESRWGGHTKEPHSVAEHSIWVMERVSLPNKLSALLHDATEPFLRDLAKPTKRKLPDYVALEKKVMAVISEKFGFKYPFDPEIKYWDDRALMFEWENKMIANTFPSMTWQEAEKKFLDCYYRLIE